ncbi:MAG: minichromosome maintenance protein MCM [Candidatus Nanoarchaeia archaeon]|nr:minichromosome maintenance protein MCM [Candidatus Nanoarchaeia archaeon]
MKESDIQLLEEFLRDFCYDKIIDAAKSDKSSFELDFKELEKFSPELADYLLDNFSDFSDTSVKIVDDMSLPVRNKEQLEPKIINLSETQKMQIKEIRAKHLRKLIWIDGLIRQASDVRPLSTLLVYECPSCGTLIDVEQKEAEITKPSRCGNCGRKGEFKMLDKKFVDTQRITVEESPEELEGGEQPKRLNVFLEKDLVNDKYQKMVTPGNRVNIYGVVREVPIILRTGGKSTRFDLIMWANNIIPMEEDYSELEINKKDEKEIKKLAKDPETYEKLIKCIAPAISGHEKIKESIILQMFGGVKKKRADGTSVRGDIHVLLVGDPGTGKTGILRHVAKLSPKGRFVTGKGTSTAGLSASVVKDEFMRGWALEAGAMVLANGGILCIDELDKMNADDRSAMHEALESQIVTISKANIHATLRSETTVLAAANPKMGRFNPYKLITEQIYLEPTLINRFDCIFTVRDRPSKAGDSRIAEHVLKAHMAPEEVKTPIEPELLRKFVAYARTKCNPQITEEAEKKIVEFYVSLRNKRIKEGEDEFKPIPISARQLEALIRLSESHARTRLAKYVEETDAEKAIELLTASLKEVGMDPETHEFDIDRITSGKTASQRVLATMNEIIEKLYKQNENMLYDDIIGYAKEQGISEEKAKDVITKKKRGGELMEPRHGIIRKVYNN